MHNQINGNMDAIKEAIFDPDNMLDIVEQCSEILAAEIDLLKQMKISQIGSGNKIKLQLIEILEKYKLLIKSRPELIKQLPSDKREKLKEAIVKFESLAQKNYELLNKTKNMHNRILNAVKDVLASRAAESSPYNQNGTKYQQNKDFVIPSLSVNENI